MKRLLMGQVEVMLHDYLFKHPMRGILVGTAITILVQSSSVTTSLAVPLLAAGIVTVEAIFPFILGANVGTTITALLASMVTGNVRRADRRDLPCPVQYLRDRGALSLPGDSHSRRDHAGRPDAEVQMVGSCLYPGCILHHPVASDRDHALEDPMFKMLFEVLSQKSLMVQAAQRADDALSGPALCPRPRSPHCSTARSRSWTSTSWIARSTRMKSRCGGWCSSTSPPTRGRYLGGCGSDQHDHRHRAGRGLREEHLRAGGAPRRALG